MENEKFNEPEVKESSLDAGQETLPESAAAEQTAPVQELPDQQMPAEAAQEAPEKEPEEPEKEPEEPKKATPGKIAVMITAIVLVIAIIAGLAVGTFGMPGAEETLPTEVPVTESTPEVVPTIPADGNPDDETCKGSYTVSDEEVKAAADTVVATIADHTLTNGELQVFYWMQLQSFLSSEYGYYMMYYGALDVAQPLDTQVSVQDSGRTWQQYFLREALNTWQNYLAMSDQATLAGMEMSQEDLEYFANIETSLAESAEYFGMDSVEDLLYANMGAGADLEDYLSFQEMLMKGNLYYDTEFEKLVPTQEELEAFFTEHEEKYAESGVSREDKYVDVRHILLIPAESETDENGNAVYTDAAWTACEAAAQALLEQWKSGDATEESFAALAGEKTQDPGSQGTGGLYENVYKGQMVPEFESWCFDETRTAGDTGIVRTTYGYHIMYYVGNEPAWVGYAEQDYMMEKMNQMLAVLTEQYPMEVDYSAIKLGYVDMAAG